MEEITYFLGEERDKPEELSRLIGQARAMNKAVGDLLPPSVDPLQVMDVLDIGTGPGDWPLEVVEKYPHMKVVGIDDNPQMIRYASAQAEGRPYRSNVEFHVMNALKPLSFPDGSFDLINSRFSSSFIPNEAWPVLFQEWKRVLRPGGVLSCTEMGIPATTSPNYGQVLQWVQQLMHARGLGFGKGASSGTIAMLPKFYEDGGFEQIQDAAYFLNASKGTIYYEKWVKDGSVAFSLMKPLMVQLLHLNSEVFDAVLQQALEEMGQDGFRLVAFLLNMTGVRPA